MRADHAAVILRQVHPVEGEPAYETVMGGRRQTGQRRRPGGQSLECGRAFADVMRGGEEEVGPLQPGEQVVDVRRRELAPDDA